MSVAGPALDLGACHHLVGCAVERGIQRNHLFLEGAGAGHSLEYRSGVVKLGYRLVLPLLLTQGGFLLLQLLVGGAGSLHLLKHLEVVCAGDLGGVIQIEAGGGRHRQNCSGVAVHYDTAGAVYYLVLGNAQLEVLLKVVLQYLVQGQHKTVAVHRGVVCVACALQFPAVGGNIVYRLSISSGEEIVIVRLKSVNAVAVEVRESNDVGGKRAVRVISLGSRPEVDIVGIQPVLVHERRDLVCLGLLHLALHYVVLAVQVGAAL